MSNSAIAIDRSKRDTLRAILETWDDYDLRQVILDSFGCKRDYIDYIMDEGLLEGEIDEIIAQEIAEKSPVVVHLTVAPEVDEEPIVAHQDCEHRDLNGELNFDLLDRCRLCARAKAECMP